MRFFSCIPIHSVATFRDFGLARSTPVVYEVRPKTYFCNIFQFLSKRKNNVQIQIFQNCLKRGLAGGVESDFFRHFRAKILKSILSFSYYSLKFVFTIRKKIDTYSIVWQNIGSWDTPWQWQYVNNFQEGRRMFKFELKF
jgi:hypothetical protein